MAKDINDQSLEARLAAMEKRNEELMTLLLERATAPQSNGINAEQLQDILKTVADGASATSNLLAKQFKPEFEHHQLGPFEHPEGGIKYPKPALLREIIFGGPLRDAELTYAEVLALNNLSKSMARSQRRLARNGKWKATVSDDDLRVTISVPVKTIDDRQDLPSFLEIVTELTTGDRPLETADLMAELMLLKQQMADLKSATSTAA